MNIQQIINRESLERSDFNISLLLFCFSLESSKNRVHKPNSELEVESRLESIIRIKLALMFTTYTYDCNHKLLLGGKWFLGAWWKERNEFFSPRLEDAVDFSPPSMCCCSRVMSTREEEKHQNELATYFEISFQSSLRLTVN